MRSHRTLAIQVLGGITVKLAPEVDERVLYISGKGKGLTYYFGLKDREKKIKDF